MFFFSQFFHQPTIYLYFVFPSYARSDFHVPGILDFATEPCPRSTGLWFWQSLHALRRWVIPQSRTSLPSRSSVTGNAKYLMELKKKKNRRNYSWILEKKEKKCSERRKFRNDRMNFLLQIFHHSRQAKKKKRNKQAAWTSIIFYFAARALSCSFQSGLFWKTAKQQFFFNYFAINSGITKKKN